jgi:hypothetical protein
MKTATLMGGSFFPISTMRYTSFPVFVSVYTIEKGKAMVGFSPDPRGRLRRFCKQPMESFMILFQITRHNCHIL